MPTPPKARASEPAISPLGDTALLIRFDARSTPPPFDAVHAAARAIERAAIPGVVESVPAFATLGVHLDPGATNCAAAAASIRTVLSAIHDATDAGRVPHEHRIPVWYDGADLADVADRSGLSRETVIAHHTAATYTVQALGFVPGFGYLGDLHPSLQLPRRDRPRTRVPAGSVAIAGAMTAVYPFGTPGGWHLIGRTDCVMFDASREPAALLAAGDIVRLVAQ